MSEEQSDPPDKSRLVDRLNAYRNVVLAVAALATAVGSWFRPTDTTATKQSFDWTTAQVELLSKNDVQMHDDIVAIRAYLEGMKAAASAPVVQPVQPVPAPQRRLSQRTRASARGIGAMPPEAPVESPELQLPILKADPHAMGRPSFEDVAVDP